MGRVPLPLEQIGRRRNALAAGSGIPGRPARPQRVQSRAESTVALLGAPRDCRQPDDLGIGELKRSGLAKEHLGGRRSKGHASREGSRSLRLLRRETRRCRG